MADNVAITPGSGAIAAADEATYSGDTAKIQLVRLVHVTGTEGSKTVSELVQAEDAAHSDGQPGFMMLGVRNYAGAGADGDYSAINVNEEGAVVAEVRPRMVRVSVQSAGLTIAATAYTAGDQVGTQFTIAGAARASGGFGYITGVTLISAADIIGAYDVVVTRASVTLAADNAAYAISDADALNVVGVIQLSGAFDIGNNRVAQAQNLRIPYDCSGGTSLFAGLITRSGHTFFGAVGDLQLIFHLELA